MKLWRRAFNVVFSVEKKQNYETVLPRKTVPSRYVPGHILKPPYYKHGRVTTVPIQATIKNAREIEKMKTSCRIASTILRDVQNIIKVGTTTDQIDEFVHNECIKNNSYPSTLYYKGYPKSVCTSVNNVACHGIPDLRPLCDGDIVNVDITIYHGGFHGDCSKTFTVGKVENEAQELIDVTEECLAKAVSICGPGVPFSEIGNVIETIVDKKYLQVIPIFLGHGIGKRFHELPEIIHIRNNQPGVMKEGMTFTIEPILSTGSDEIRILNDGWTAVTIDNSRTAQAEHTILITSDGCVILTDQH